jgi:hypothetical protein
MLPQAETPGLYVGLLKPPSAPRHYLRPHLQLSTDLILLLLPDGAATNKQPARKLRACIQGPIPYETLTIMLAAAGVSRQHVATVE